MHQSLNHDKSGAASGPSAGADSRRTVWVVCLVLAALTLAVFGRTTRFGFVNYDDGSFVYNSPAVTNGLTAAGVAEAFTHGSIANWDPLTTLSHMADCEVYGLNAGGHHLTNVLLHAASAVLLFLVLRRLTGALWPSAFVAAVFAIHPLRVESVAWIAERKDVLSGFFFMLTLGAYARYAEGAPKPGRYLTVVLCFALGLMSKSMLVTLPFVLLLLDYWPLGRIRQLQREGTGAWTALRSRVILEKIPLMALSAASCVVTIMTQRQGAAVQSLEHYPLYLRLENAVVSLATYIIQMFWPARLAVMYPFSLYYLGTGRLLAAIGLTAAIFAVVWRFRRTRPYLLTGWLWCCGMLLPVIGLVQVGRQAHADRYTYLPQIGLYMALTWLAVSWGNGQPRRRTVLGGIAVMVVAALGVSAFNQTSYWRDSEKLWRHDLACVPDNQVARNNLGLFLADAGRRDEAIIEFRQAIKLDPETAEPHNNLGSVLAEKGRMNEAIDEFRNAFQLQPGYARARKNLSLALHQTGRWEELYNFGAVLLQQGRQDEAIAQFQDALTINPSFGRAWLALELVAWDLATSPDDTKRNGAKALALAQQLTSAPNGGDPTCLATLAAAYAETGRFADATAAAERARELALAQTNSPLAGFVQQQLADYQAGRPFRDVSPTNAPAQR